MTKEYFYGKALCVLTVLLVATTQANIIFANDLFETQNLASFQDENLSLPSEPVKVKVPFEKLKDILNEENRKRYKRVIFVGDREVNIRFKIVQEALLLSVLEDNFPDAELNAYSHLSPLYKGGRTKRIQFHNPSMWRKEIVSEFSNEDLVIYVPNRGYGQELKGKFDFLYLNLNQPTLIRDRGLSSQEEIIEFLPAFEHRYTFERMWHVFQEIGLTIPDNLESAISLGGNLSPAVRAQRKQLRDLFEEKFQSRDPGAIIFVNLLKNMEGNLLWDKEKWQSLLENLAREFKGVIILNGGPKGWEKNPENLAFIEDMRQKMSEANGQAKVIVIKINSLTKYTAMLSLSDAFVEYESGGSSLLNLFPNIYNFVIQTENPVGVPTIRYRDKVVTFYSNSNWGEIFAAIKGRFPQTFKFNDEILNALKSA